jgi:biopolymer transport protein ExbB/TolQ
MEAHLVHPLIIYIFIQSIVNIYRILTQQFNTEKQKRKIQSLNHATKTAISKDGEEHGAWENDNSRS